MWRCSIQTGLLLMGWIGVALVSDSFADDKPSGPPEFTYRPVRQFVKLPPGFTLGSCSGVAINSHGEIYLFQRGPHPLICLDSEGNYLRSWGDDYFRTPHGLRVDRDDNVWVTDVGTQKVYKFDANGKLLLALGTGEAGMGNDQFDRPTDVAFGPNDELYVSDGYGNSRVMKFTTAGRFVTAWGTPGTGPGQFHLPHAIVVDAMGRVLVGDRENNRIQIFDSDGQWLDTWSGFAPYGLAFDSEGRLFVADGRAGQVLLLGENGHVRKRWGRTGSGVGQFQMPHTLALDAAGNLLVAEVNGMRLQKFERVLLSDARKPRQRTVAE